MVLFDHWRPVGFPAADAHTLVGFVQEDIIRRRGKSLADYFDFMRYSVLQKYTGKEVAWPN